MKGKENLLDRNLYELFVAKNKRTAFMDAYLKFNRNYSFVRWINWNVILL